MKTLDEKITKMEERLKQLKHRQVRIEARRRTLSSRRSRRDDTRRKIIVGAVVLAKVDQALMPASTLHEWLDAALTRPDDRALFALPPQPVLAARAPTESSTRRR
jgi:hypothetical protein